jgi:hypothetical protein
VGTCANINDIDPRDERGYRRMADLYLKKNRNEEALKI